MGLELGCGDTECEDLFKETDWDPCSTQNQFYHCTKKEYYLAKQIKILVSTVYNNYPDLE